MADFFWYQHSSDVLLEGGITRVIGTDTHVQEGTIVNDRVGAVSDGHAKLVEFSRKAIDSPVAVLRRYCCHPRCTPAVRLAIAQ